MVNQTWKILEQSIKVYESLTSLKVVDNQICILENMANSDLLTLCRTMAKSKRYGVIFKDKTKKKGVCIISEKRKSMCFWLKFWVLTTLWKMARKVMW